ncbi:phage tailspike protein [Serratia bockelmannii]|uniref:phage tailspike protein n=1 Tax=Serratia bockelmannii TaxID=2703793 RepID=UPI003FA77396
MADKHGVVISMPTAAFSEARAFRGISNGQIFVGRPGTDPTIIENQVQVYVAGPTGDTPVSQPILTNSGGYPVYNGQVSKFTTNSNYSMAVLDADGAQQFYFSDLIEANSSQILGLLASPDGSDFIGTKDGTLTKTITRIDTTANAPTLAARDAAIAAKNEAISAKNDAKHYADIASMAPGMYQSVAAAQQDINDGKIPAGAFFLVYSNQPGVVAAKYQNVSGVATFTGENFKTDVYVGRPVGWVNSGFNTFYAANQNRMSFAATSATYQEAVGTISTVATGNTVDVYYQLDLNGGTAPFIQLRGADWASNAVKLIPSKGLLKATLTATADANQIRIYNANGSTTDCNLFMFLNYGEENSFTSAMVSSVNESQRARVFAEKDLTSSGFSSFFASSPNTFSYSATGTGYAEIRISMMPIASGGVFSFKSRLSSNSAWTYIRLYDSSKAAWASAETILSTDGVSSTLNVPSTAGYLVDTVVVYTRAQATAFDGSGFLGLMSVGGVYFSGMSAVEGMPREDFGVGYVNSWKNNVFDVLAVAGKNELTYATNTVKYGEARSAITVNAGQSVTVYFRIKSTVGGLPFIRLRSATDWASDEVALTQNAAVSAVTLTATANATSIVMYTKATAASSGVIWMIVKGGAIDSQMLAISNLADSIIGSAAFAENGKPVANAGMSSFSATSNNSWTFSSPGTAYAEVSVPMPKQPASATLRVRYSVKSNSTNTFIRLRSGDGANWAGVETPIVTDGEARSVDLATTAGMQADRIVIYSRTQPAYSGTAFVSLLAVNGKFISSTAAYNELAASSDSGVQQSTGVMFPSSLCLLAARPVTLYGENFISGAREWLSGANMAISSTPAAGKPSVLRSALPDVTFRPEEIGGTTIEVNARADDTANVFRKSAAVRVATPVVAETIKVCALMDSHGSICVPWLYRAVNSTGSVYQGVGMYSIEGIPFEGRAGWATFSYMGRRSEDTFTNPFLKTADANDKSSWPQWCYDTAYSGQSYADNPNLPSYHIFDVAAWAAARGLTAADKLVVVLQLGVNDRWRGYAAADVAAAQDFMISRFKSVLPQCRFVVSSHSIGWTSERDWSTYTPYIMQKIIKFDGRESQNILQAPAWAFMSAKYGWRETAVGTLPGGVVQVALNDDIHPTDLGAAQWADALVGGVIAAWHL